MKNSLSDHDRLELDKLVQETEKRTHCQIVLSVIGRCDVYEELPWKAFALGASLTGLFVILLNSMYPLWYSMNATLVTVSWTLTGGALFSLLTVLLAGFARYFLTPQRSEAEVKQYAQALFLERELFATQKRTGILILVSLFERKIVILPDTGLKEQLSEKVLHTIIGAMIPILKKGKLRKAFETGLELLTRILQTGSPGTDKDELPNAIIEEKGE